MGGPPRPPLFVPKIPAAPYAVAAIQPVARRDSVSRRVPWNIPTATTPKAWLMRKRSMPIKKRRGRKGRAAPARTAVQS